MSEEPAKFGDKVLIHFKAMLPDGFIVESTIGKDPIEFIIGQNRFPIGLEEAVEGMAVGETKKVDVPPEKGHGHWKENLVKEVELPAEDLAKVEPGKLTMVNAAEGMQVPALVTKKEGNVVWLDFNHPLADKTLTYEVRLMEIVDRAL